MYEHSTVAREAFAEIFEGLGAEVVRRGRSSAFLPVDTEAIRPQDIELGRTWASEENFDAIISADGDGDRPLIGDEHGDWLRGDVLGILTAHFLDADQVVTPISSNTALEKSGWFEGCRRTRIGSPYVIEGMQQSESEGGKRVVGFEANGGFLIQTDIEREGRVLEALPTRDAAVVALAVVLTAQLRGMSVSQLREELPQRFTASDRLRDFPTEIGRERLDALHDGGGAAIQAQFPGLGSVMSVDTTDGLRIEFDNGDIVHLRPSGNAPELRCYTESSSPARAVALNRECLSRAANWRPVADGG